MSGFNVNTEYFQHSDPKWNKKHAEEISEYNAEYYETHKEKWKDNKKSDDDEEEKKDSSKSGSDDEEKKDSKDKSSGSSGKSKEEKIKDLLKKINGGSKKGGSANKSSKKSSTKSSSKKETDEEKKKREEEEKAEKEREAEETRKKNAEAAEKYNKVMEANAKYIEEQQKGKKKSKPNVAKSNKAVKHSAVYVGINSQPYFEHHGRLGMKWGKRNGPPYPLDYSKLSEEERAKDKARVKEEGDIESVGYKKNRSYFTDQEINEVINRYQLNTRINQLSAESAKMKAGKSKTEQLIDKMQKVSDVGFKLGNAINAGTSVYNNVAKVMNAFGDADLPIIGQAKSEKNKAEKLSKKELDRAINELEKNLGNYSNKELETMNKRRTMFNQLTSDRDAKRKADAETAAAAKAAKDEEARAKAQKQVDEYNERTRSQYSSKGNEFSKEYFNNTVEHVTGDVVDKDGRAYVMAYLEDKQRR